MIFINHKFPLDIAGSLQSLTITETIEGFHIQEPAEDQEVLETSNENTSEFKAYKMEIPYFLYAKIVEEKILMLKEEQSLKILEAEHQRSKDF